MTSNLNIEDIPVALLAGGLATRLGPIAQATPKALVNVNGRPFISHQLDLLHQNGIRKVVLCVGHFGEHIEQYLGGGTSHGMEIQYSYDGPTLAGTGGAIRKALPLLGDLFWVMYGDSYMNIDYRSALKHFGQAREKILHSKESNLPPLGLMTVLRNDNSWDRSNAIFRDGRLTCYDKRNRHPAMHHIDYGVQLLCPNAILPIRSAKRCDLADIYSTLAAQGRMIGHEVFTRFYEIGTPDSLAETRWYLASKSSSDVKNESELCPVYTV